jgi:peptide/nickel transport system permease protein
VPLFWLSGQYHVFGTDKVGQDVSSTRYFERAHRADHRPGHDPGHAAAGRAARHRRRLFPWLVDDAIQYIYTVLNSIPGVLLIAAAVLMMQVVIDSHPEWFSTAAERADLRLLALCFILGITSWTGLCRSLRGETLKLRELEYIQAAQAFGVSTGGSSSATSCPT